MGDVRSARIRVQVLFCFLGLVAVGAFSCGEDDSPSDSDANHAPVIDTVMVHPNPAFQGETVDVTVEATDEDGDSLTYSYDPDGGTIIGTGPEVRWAVPQATGAHAVLATARDGRGGVDSWSAGLTVQEEPTGIIGTAALAVPGESMVGAIFSLYLSSDSLFAVERYYAELVPASSPTVFNFAVLYMPPGTYYLDIWKDVDGDGSLDADDLYGFYGSGTWAERVPKPITVQPFRRTNIGTIPVS